VSKPPPEREPPPRRWLLPAADQATLAFITAAALVVIGACWVYQGALRGRLIDIEQAPPQVVTFQLDINQADWPEWTVLPGVGEALAKRIVAERESGGLFRDHAELLRVRGIGPRTLERLQPYLLPLPDVGAVVGSSPDGSGAALRVGSE
jgi:competence protein ComEA